jgi:beta-1,4-mannosyltransferase
VGRPRDDASHCRGGEQGMSAEERDIRVLVPFHLGRSTTNPYLTQLYASLPEGTSVLSFSWRTALLGRYDVFHVHWPEILLRGSSPLKTGLRRSLALLLLLRMRVSRVALVRTLHNTAAHESGSRIEGVLLGLFWRSTDAFVRLNPRTPAPEGRPVETITHGHYRDWFAGHPPRSPQAGRLAYFGLIRPYKNVPELVTAFRGVADAARSLLVMGKPSDPGTERSVIDAVAGDNRVTLMLSYVDDATLASELTGAELVVLPYADMHNSGAALLALSLGRAVLVPDNDVTRDLAAEVGDTWVRRFSSPLTPELLVGATRDLPSDEDRPDLSGRDWAPIGLAHRRLYERALRRP